MLYCHSDVEFRCLYGVDSIKIKKPYSTVDKCAVISFDTEKIRKIKLNREGTILIDIYVTF